MSGQRIFNSTQGRRNTGSLATSGATAGPSNTQSQSAAQRPQKQPKPPPPNYPSYSWQEVLHTGMGARSLHYITNLRDAEQMIPQLRGPAVGFDAEWKPNFVKGQAENPIALVQLADDHLVLLIHISRMGWQVPDALKTLLENPNILKIGVGINGDKSKVSRDLHISLEGTLELSQFARTVDFPRWADRSANSMVSLAKLIEIYVVRILPKPKKLQRGNWEMWLGADMQHYAANDAAAGLAIYSALVELQANAPPNSDEIAGSSSVAGVAHTRAVSTEEVEALVSNSNDSTVTIHTDKVVRDVSPTFADAPTSTIVSDAISLIDRLEVATVSAQLKRKRPRGRARKPTTSDSTPSAQGGGSKRPNKRAKE